MRLFCTETDAAELRERERSIGGVELSLVQRKEIKHVKPARPSDDESVALPAVIPALLVCPKETR